MLKVQPNSIEAVNNKAWILHTYLGRSQEALELVMDLKKHVAPTALPGEFFDTLGTIQESIGQTRDAEQSYLDGLKKSPENPALNFHFGRLLAADHSRATKAKVHLNKALARSRTTQRHHGARGGGPRPGSQRRCPRELERPTME